MYKNIQNFMPFEHDNLEFKNNIIAVARSQDKTKFEGIFTAVLIYTNLVDYLAKHLLDNLNKMVSIYTFKNFGGVFYFDGSSKKSNLPLGGLHNELRCFDFPNKEDFLNSLDEFKKIRNQVMHNLMQVDPDDKTNKFDKDMQKVGEIAEDVLSKYNTIVGGITAIWNQINTTI